MNQVFQVNPHLQKGLTQLLQKLLNELDVEYQALHEDQTSLLKISQLRQRQLQNEIETLLSGQKASPELRPLLDQITQKLKRNLAKARELHSIVKEELNQLGKIRRVRRQFFPQKNEKNTPVLIDIRR